MAEALPRALPRPAAGLGLPLALIALVLAAAVAGPSLAPFDPLAPDAGPALLPPGWAHPCGTDALGRDVLSRLLVATRLDLAIAVAAVLLSVAAGTAIGAVAGWAGGWTDRVVGRALEMLMAFPLFVLAVGIAAALGSSVLDVIVTTAVVNLPFYARQVRAEVARRRHAAYVDAARIGGFSAPAIVAWHILPGVVPGLAVQSSLNVAWAILNAAGLSFIGLGVRPPQPEWGIMVSEGAGTIISGEWWLFLFPGLALMLAVLAFSLLGDALRDLIDPRGRAMTPPLLQVRGLTIGFGGAAPVLDAVDLDIARGEVVGLVGESGSGKSLLATAVAGMLDRRAGLAAERLRLRRYRPARARGDPWRDLRGREIGMVWQNPRAALNPTRRVSTSWPT